MGRFTARHAILTQQKPVGATVFHKISKLAQSLWERVYPRTPAKPVPYTALFASR
ncbi:hypothetical protein IAE36_002831, partial [Pseudomonas sp. S36]|nr:hypothetical protein [Pseudomonas sp. S36]